MFRFHNILSKTISSNTSERRMRDSSNATDCDVKIHIECDIRAKKNASTGHMIESSSKYQAGKTKVSGFLSPLD